MTGQPVSERVGPPLGAQSSGAIRALSLVRLGVVLFLTTGVFLLQDRVGPAYLLPIYIAALVAALAGLFPEWLPARVRARLPLAHVLLDFVVVGATVSITDGPASLFTSIFIVVVLESGILLGLAPSFYVSTLASVFMLTQVVYNGSEQSPVGLELWYNFLVQTLAFYLTAFMAGYWTQRLRQMQAFQREILDNMNSGFLIADSEGIVTASNSAAAAILELRGSPIGRSIQTVLRGETGGESPAYTALRSGRDFTSYEFTVVTPSEKRKLLGLTTSRMFDSSGRVTGVIASFTDLTEMDEMRREVLRQDRMAAVGELAAGLAHEIRNPVAVIRGAADEMSAQPGGSDVQARLRSMVLRESDHLNEIVTGFLNFAREPSVKRERVNVIELVSEVVESLRLETELGADLAVTVDAPAHPCAVYGDRSQLKQVFVNLGNNAIESMNGRGELTIVIAGGLGDPVQVRFEDEGPGIPPDEVARIFEPFYTTKATGVGMGLAVCARILTAHDGTIRATARQGGGCAMNITLPVAAPEEIASE